MCQHTYPSMEYPGVGVGWLGQKPETMLLSWQLATSINFSPFMKISTRPSFAEAYLGHEDPPRGWGAGGACLDKTYIFTNYVAIHSVPILKIPVLIMFISLKNSQLVLSTLSGWHQMTQKSIGQKSGA